MLTSTQWLSSLLEHLVTLNIAFTRSKHLQVDPASCLASELISVRILHLLHHLTFDGLLKFKGISTVSILTALTLHFAMKTFCTSLTIPIIKMALISIGNHNWIWYPQANMHGWPCFSDKYDGDQPGTVMRRIDKFYSIISS